MSHPIARTSGLHARWPALALAVFIAAPALANDSPILSQMQAIDLSSRVARQVPGVTDLVIAPMPYEAANELAAKTSEEAKLHPPPDLEDLWLTVLLKISPSTTPPAGYGSTWYVSVSTGADKPVDLPATAIAKAQIPGIKILPASAAPGVTAGNGATQGDYHIGIGIPLKRPDGNYDVTYGYYCGVVCGTSVTAVMSHDHWGWHIVSSRRNWVS
ncbi:hypothetical protein C8J98_103396 [Luteibacter sp. OK325]|uniref:hypothetical protein n=1 Tax=Luteibacter sp. OK325 TaxID=2135670 RepID=UPI000D36AABA|nr:hypothetical protein [Luteibacter sp. OK325]PTR33633.1 hypothetical protein C8J98_103396 [Luteibacter sp. OK325]